MTKLQPLEPCWIALVARPAELIEGYVWRVTRASSQRRMAFAACKQHEGYSALVHPVEGIAVVYEKLLGRRLVEYEFEGRVLLHNPGGKKAIPRWSTVASIGLDRGYFVLVDFGAGSVVETVQKENYGVYIGA